ncbi:MAG: helix-turn-helix domain-containing protein [Butyrivibrio sp.]|nr:helix-turn-helix domain-containing protein [Acetatifactor muris]MCM1558245.1 helix-turn-helix domain-containing protein [Butyrivibrio sp.]
MGNYLFISDAAKEVKVESHVLRYWEEELHLPIKRNELGHRYYTKEDVERFKTIKGMKERGLQLKAIKMILKDGKLDLLSGQPESLEKDGVKPAEQLPGAVPGTVPPAQDDFAGDTLDATVITASGDAADTDIVQSGSGVLTAESKEEKSKRLQWLLQQLIRETLQENNAELCREIRESVVKELDYQFRMQEERDELRDKKMQERDDEYYKKMDELLRKKARKGFGRDKKKKGSS